MQLLPQAGVVWRFLVFMTILDEILDGRHEAIHELVRVPGSLWPFVGRRQDRRWSNWTRWNDTCQEPSRRKNRKDAEQSKPCCQQHARPEDSDRRYQSDKRRHRQPDQKPRFRFHDISSPIQPISTPSANLIFASERSEGMDISEAYWKEGLLPTGNLSKL